MKNTKAALAPAAKLRALPPSPSVVDIIRKKPGLCAKKTEFILSFAALAVLERQGLELSDVLRSRMELFTRLKFKGEPELTIYSFPASGKVVRKIHLELTPKKRERGQPRTSPVLVMQVIP